jgi:hypothetical protein
MIDIKADIKKLLKSDYGIPEEVTDSLFERHILQEYVCRNVLITEEYLRKLKPKERQRIKGNIAEKYCISMALVRKIVEITT